jgi:hypothetical protein
LYWTIRKTYQLADLKKALQRAIAADDDILTQFVDSGDLTNAINMAASFENVFEILRKCVFDFDEIFVSKLSGTA